MVSLLEKFFQARFHLLFTKKQFMSTQCPQLDQIPDNIRTYWEKKQQERGEALYRFSFAVLVQPGRIPATEKSGILYIMERNVWFEDFPKPPLFFLNQSSNYKKTEIHISRASIIGAELLRQSAFEERFFDKRPSSGLLQNILTLFKTDPIYCIISERQKNGSLFQHVFRGLEEAEDWLKALQPHEQ
ncbi:hypothetical protein CSA56_11800 [candidate division KSB3 bacterium]|uniref:Uncharacterized protein n=1 Tax=candidate division KSB3 bacterium TaxID=2044937 RepID=A0A2G6KDL5_9BACT|nr:MAG: hypothetical protein CSA56_11800 [candidate division KSB3 bacterium]